MRECALRPAAAVGYRRCLTLTPSYATTVPFERRGLATALEARGYVARSADPLDARRKRLEVTALGFEVMRVGEDVFDELRDKWKGKIGAKQLERLESDLVALVGVSPVSVESPGWIANSLDETT